MNKEQIFKDVMFKWGKPLQIMMSIVEMSELTKELIKHLRGKEDTNRILEEMADVDIMLSQLKYLFDYGGEFNKIRIKKMKKLEQMVKEGE